MARCATLTVRRIQQCVYRSDSKEGYSGYSDVFYRMQANNIKLHCSIKKTTHPLIQKGKNIFVATYINDLFTIVYGLLL